MDSCDENCNSSNNEHTCKGEFKGKKRVGGPLTDGKKYARRTHRKTEDTVDLATKVLDNLGLCGYEDLPPQALFPMLGQIVSNMANQLMDLTHVKDKQSCLEVITKSLLSRLSDSSVTSSPPRLTESQTTAAAAASTTAPPSPHRAIAVTPASGRRTSVVPVQLNKNAFQVKAKRDGSLCERSPEAARQMKWRHKMNFVDQFNDMVQKHGRTHEQQLLLCYDLLKKQKPTSSPLGAAAKLWSENLPLTPEAKCKAEDAATRKEIIDNVACTYNLAKATRSADSITTRNTMLMAMAPQSPSKIKNKDVNRFCRVFQVKQDRRRFALNLRQASVAKKKIINGTSKELLQRYQIKGHSRYSPDFIRGLRQWLLEKCDFIQPSPNARDTVTVTDPETGDKMLVRKYLLVGSMNDAYQQFISKGRNGCDLAYDSDDELVVRDTTFRKFFPREITHATDTQKITCGCEVCIISGSMIKDLHVWEREHLKKLNRAFGQCQTDIIHAVVAECSGDEQRRLDALLNSARQRLNKFVEEAFDEEGIHHWQAPKQVISSMTCPPVTVGENDKIHKLSCCLGRCNDCPKLVIPQEELDESNNNTITFACYESHSFCRKHLTLPGAPTKCHHCALLPEKERGKFIRKKQLTKKVKPIGVFMKDYFVPMMERARYHRQKVILLSTNHCGKDRREHWPSVDGCIFTQRDYTEAFALNFTREIQSTGFGDTEQVGMEGVSLSYKGEDDKIHHIWTSFLSDDKRQDARTTLANQVKFLDFLENEDHPEIGIHLVKYIYELLDGCTKQYRCSLALFLMSYLSHLKHLTVNRMIQAPSHGKGICDCMCGNDKSYLSRCLRWVRDTAKIEIGGNKYDLEPFAVGPDGKKANHVQAIINILSHPDRSHGVKSASGKRAKREDQAFFELRKYFEVHHGNTDAEKNSELKMVLSKGCKCVGFEKNDVPNGIRHNGIMDHYHLYTCHELGLRFAAVRRYPCSCNACHSKIMLPWDNTLPLKSREDRAKQPRFQHVPDCKYAEIFEELNDWKIIELVIGQAVEEELEEVFEDVLAAEETRARRDLKAGSFFAYSSPESDYYVGECTQEPWALEEDSDDVEGCLDTVPTGTLVFKGKFWNDVKRAKRCYTPNQQDPKIFRVRYVVGPCLQMENITGDTQMPMARQIKEQLVRLGAKKVTEESHDAVMVEVARRAVLDYEEGLARGDADGDEDSDMEEDTDEEE
jgi:hypothetical protein